MKQLTQADFSTNIAKGLVVVDFFATRCGPCKMIAPYLEEMQEKLWETVRFYKVDVDEQSVIAAQYAVTAMPTLKVFRDGHVVATVVWADLKSLRQAIQDQLSKIS